MSRLLCTFNEALEVEEFRDSAEACGGYWGLFSSDVAFVFETMYGTDGLYLGWESDCDGMIQGAQIQIPVSVPDAPGTYGWLVRFIEWKYLTDDRDATGVEAYRAIWSALEGEVAALEALEKASALASR